MNSLFVKVNSAVMQEQNFWNCEFTSMSICKYVQYYNPDDCNFSIVKGYTRVHFVRRRTVFRSE